jgi:hypothetical protein
VEFGDALIADLSGSIAAEHLSNQVTALAAKATAKIFIKLIEILLGFFLRGVGLHPSRGGMGINALGPVFGAGDGIVHGSGDGIPITFAVVEDYLWLISGLADGQARNFFDFFPIDEQQAVAGVEADGGIQNGVVKETVGGNCRRR